MTRVLPKDKQIDLNILWKDLEDGASLRQMADRYGINHTTLASRLRRSDKERYNEIMERRKWRSKWYTPKIGEGRTSGIGGKVDPKIWNELENTSLTLDQIADKYDIGHTSVQRWLQQNDRERYLRTMNRRSRRAKRGLPQPAPEIWCELESAAVSDVAKEHKINDSTLAYRLQKSDRERYKSIVKRNSYASPRAKLLGADSLSELKIRELLKSHNCPFRYHSKIQPGNHEYVPDFTFEGKIILEVGGIPHEAYWIRCREKFEAYLKNGNKVFLAVLDELYEKAKDSLLEYLTDINVIRYSYLVKRIKEFVVFVESAS